MARRPRRRPRVEKLLEHRNILPEVLSEIKRIRKRKKKEEDQIDVIIEIRRGHTPEHVKEELTKLDVDPDTIRSTDYYVSSVLTTDQVEKISECDCVFKIWLNRKTRAMLGESVDTIKARPTWSVFGARGQGVNWAILDTGINKDHPAFKDFAPDDPKIVQQFDFSGEGIGDQNGHGTHVAGIVAANDEDYKGVAPLAKLWDFKVLDAEGFGNQFNAIQAMAEIRKINEERREMAIHGANLSLGWEVDVRNYACGHSPVCVEANRLVHSGVVVCAAASNDGYKMLKVENEFGQEELYSTYMALGITDPGNASEVITVGSTHKRYPHRYGISYFSSRGPTGDGRLKPDLVAPGERIVSCGLRRGYVEMSGTSMATPHVSGAIALLLSMKRGLIGQPQQVKELLLANCTDLGRERYFQGYGLLDIFRTIQAF